MRFKYVARIGSAAVLVLLLSVPIFASPPATSAPGNGSDEVNWFAADRASKLLEALQRLNVDLARDGETLTTFARSNQFSWQSHTNYLGNVRDHVNAAGNLLRELQGLRNSALPWQRQAIDRIHPIAVELAQHTQAAIDYLRENQGGLWVQEYTEHLTAIGESSADFRGTVNEFLEYRETQEKLQQLEQSLEISG